MFTMFVLNLKFWLKMEIITFIKPKKANVTGLLCMKFYT